MLGNVPFCRYYRHHHVLWIVRKAFPTKNIRKVILVLLFAGLVLTPVYLDGNMISGMGLGFIFIGILSTEMLWLGYTVLDWKTRTIRLYSDGRLDYEYGILFRKGISVSMRFGTVQYVFHDRIGTWLDCADLLLPFDAGTISDIPDFTVFWSIAQGRV